MATFAEYFVEALEREGVNAQELIRAWTQDERDQVTEKIGNAIELSGVMGKHIPDFKGANQSKGYQAAAFLFIVIAGHMGNPNTIMTAPGKCYPDMIFSLDGATFCMEFKATSAWRDWDSNRRVLTSATSKLRSLIQDSHVGNLLRQRCGCDPRQAGLPRARYASEYQARGVDIAEAAI